MPTDHPTQMVLHARQACRFGRSSPQNKIGVYSAQNIAIKERQSDIQWTPIIKKALREDQLFLLFQPVVELDNGVISHYEVLLRMRHEKEIILPDVFIPVAERMGLMQSLDLWVIENAIDFLATLPSHRSYVSVSVKLSASAYQYPDLIDIIRYKLELTWVDASRLIFEIAEIAVLENFQSTLDLVNKIRSLGCKCAIKHGSTGFYSLDYANSFPVEYIKINGKFTKHTANEENNKILLKSIVDMVTKLGKKVIFVYVESPYTVQKLREIGVPLAQGYTLGKPECNLLEEASIPFSQYISERHSAEKALREKESYLRVLIDNIPFLVWLKDANSRFLTVNQLLAEQLGLSSPEAIVGKTDFDFYPPDKARRYQADDREVLASRQRKTVEEAANSHLGVRRWIETFLAPIVDDSGDPLGTLGFARDITERKNIEADLRIAATAFESQEGMIVTDAETVILKVNHSFTRITGYSAEETVGGKMNLLQSDIQDADFYAEMWERIGCTGNWQGEIRNKRKNGETYTAWLSITAVKVEEDVVTHYVGTMIDITTRKAIEEQMHHIAHHDVLTDLPNRILLADRLHQALAHARRDTSKLALLYIDLDKFKPVNDNFGHDVGDLLLKEVASRISACIRRESDTVSRLGGDEFVILLPNYDKEANVVMLAQKVLDSLSEPFFIEQNLINISSSIGIATFPAHGDDAGSLMKNADNAMYQAKHAGRSCLKFFG
ncbi:MAG: EAL domain-containing protein, partial [Methylomonas sp.]